MNPSDDMTTLRLKIRYKVLIDVIFNLMDEIKRARQADKETLDLSLKLLQSEAQKVDGEIQGYEIFRNNLKKEI